MGLDFQYFELELTPGSSHDYQVGLWECCYFWEPIDACESYTVDPADAGASIDPDTGLLMIDPNTPDSTSFTVTADVNNGEASVQGEVFVYLPELHPLRGYWTEVARIPCDAGPEFVPSDPIGELRFTAAGDVQVTWTPFEVYVDYWGTYVHDLQTGALTFSDLGGNYVPVDVDGEGTVSFEGNQLVLTDMWLGSSQAPVEPAACGHRFE